MISKSSLCKQEAAGLSVGRTRVHSWCAGLGAGCRGTEKQSGVMNFKRVMAQDHTMWYSVSSTWRCSTVTTAGFSDPLGMSGGGVI